MDVQNMDVEFVDQLVDALDRLGNGHLTVITGAGISVASGIPTFRGDDPGAVWKRDITELGTVQYFREDPVGSWEWYLSRFSKVLDARPNPAHQSLVALERWQLERGGRYLLITQNVDTLHEDAGAHAMVKVHGTADRVRCSRDGCRYGAPNGSLPRSDFDMEPFLQNPSLEGLPKCPECGAILRQHVLWFDELYQGHEDYQWRKVQEAATLMGLALFVGTSFAVGVTDMFVQHALSVGIPAISIDPGGTPPPYPGIQVIPAKAEELLPQVCERLGLSIS
jgi:NAD-dependent deacetylase